MYAVQETTVGTMHGTDWFPVGKGVCQGCILSPCLFTSMQSISCKMPDCMKHTLESRVLGEIKITSNIQMAPPLWQKLRGTKEPLDENEKGK